jgi:hypothetical protein
MFFYHLGNVMLKVVCLHACVRVCVCVCVKCVNVGILIAIARIAVMKYIVQVSNVCLVLLISNA